MVTFCNTHFKKAILHKSKHKLEAHFMRCGIAKEFERISIFFRLQPKNVKFGKKF